MIAVPHDPRNTARLREILEVERDWIVEVILLLHRGDDFRRWSSSFRILKRIAGHHPREEECDGVDREHDERQLQ